MRSTRITAISALLLAVLIAPLPAGDLSGVTVALSVDLGDSSQQSLARVVQGAVEVSLTRYGLRASDPANSDSEDFALEATVHQTKGSAEVTLELRDAVSGRLLSAGRMRHAVDLTLDRPITSLATQMLDQARPALLAAAERRAAQRGIAAVDEPNSAEEAATKPDDTEPGNAAPVREVPSEATAQAPSSRGGINTQPPAAGRFTASRNMRPAPPALPVAPPRESPASTSPASPRTARKGPGLMVSTAAASVLPVHRSARYMSVSYGGAASLVGFPFAARALGLGVTVGGVAGTITGSAATASLLLVPVAIVVTLVDVSSAVAPCIRLEGGAAVMQASTRAAGVLAKLVPHGGVDLGARAAISRRLDAQLSVGFDAYFEGSILLIGFSPTLGLAMRL